MTVNRSIAKPMPPWTNAARECASSRDTNLLSTSSTPKTLSIPQGRLLRVLHGLIFLVPLAFLVAIFIPTLLDRAILFSVGGVVVGYLSRAATFASIGETGVAWWSASRLGRAESLSVEWKDIETVSRRNEDRLHMLCIFPRQILNNWPPLKPGSRRTFAQWVDEWFRPWPRGLQRIDIDFSFAERPGSAVERAFEACASWIAFSRGNDSRVPVVREFGELTVSEVGNLARGRVLVRAVAAFLSFFLVFAIGTWFAT
jgi:hypothetical protein